MRTITLLLLSTVPVFAGAIVSVSFENCDSTGGTMSDPVSAQYAQSCNSQSSGTVAASGSSEASVTDLSAHASSNVHSGGAVSHATAEAASSFDVNATGLYAFQFSLTGTIARDAGGGIAYFSVAGDGLNAQWQAFPDAHWLSIHETFTTAPVMLSGYYSFTADVKAHSDAYPLDWGMGDASIRATFLGLEPVAVDLGAVEAAEPATATLVAVPVFLIILGRRFAG